MHECSLSIILTISSNGPLVEIVNCTGRLLAGGPMKSVGRAGRVYFRQQLFASCLIDTVIYHFISTHFFDVGLWLGRRRSFLDNKTRAMENQPAN
jgi:hypothetical protein